MQIFLRHRHVFFDSAHEKGRVLVKGFSVQVFEPGGGMQQYF